MISSASPSQRKSSSFAPLMLAKGRTAIEGFSRTASGAKRASGPDRAAGPRHAASAFASSSAEAKRSSGRLARHRSTTACSSRGASTPSFASGSGASCTIPYITAWAYSPANGGRPATSS